MMRTNGTPILEVREADFSFGSATILERLSLTVSHGGRLGIVGRNGSGKTTLVRLINGLLVPSRGMVLLEGQDLRTLARREIARIVAVVHQEESPEFGFSVREHVSMGRAPHHGGLHFEDRRDTAIVDDAMERTGIADLGNRTLSQLSGGERQKVRIARALAQSPSVLILDEPTNHLDLGSQLALAELLIRLNEDGLTVVVVSHDINFVSGLCEEAAMVHEHTIAFDGPVSVVLTEANISRVFGVSVVVDRHPVHGGPRITPTMTVSR